MLLSSNLVERFSFTSCNFYRNFPSLTGTSLLGSLQTDHPEFLSCDRDAGLRLMDDYDASSVPSAAILLESEFDTTDFLPEFDENVTIAVWMTPAQGRGNYSEYLPILSLASADDGAGCQGYDFILFQDNDTVVVSYTVDDKPDCRFIRVPIEMETKNHIAVTFAEGVTHTFVNGQQAAVGSPNAFSMPTAWVSSTKLQLFTSTAKSFQSYKFRGALHQVEFWKQDIWTDEAAAMYQEGAVSAESEDVLVVSARAGKVGTIRQDALESLPISLSSYNTTASLLQLQVLIVSLPAHGLLLLDGQEISKNCTIPIPLDLSSVTVDYKLNSSDYFNVPNKDANGKPLALEPESFEFRILAVDSRSEEVVSQSRTCVQDIQVVHVNHAPVLITPSQVFRDSVDPLSSTIVAGIELDDRQDWNIDRVRVEISTALSDSMLRLNSLCRSRADFSGTRNSDLQCDQDGDNFLTFVAAPLDVTFILRNLRYEGNGDGDQILVRVFDGSGGACLEELEHAATREGITSIRDECYQAQAVIIVPSVEESTNHTDDSSKNGKYDKKGFLSFETPGEWTFYGVFVVISILSIGWCGPKVRSYLARGKPVDADAAGDNTKS
jgi:Concanavalin A-like lectin/glucanases superfamily